MARLLTVPQLTTFEKAERGCLLQHWDSEGNPIIALRGYTVLPNRGGEEAELLFSLAQFGPGSVQWPYLFDTWQLSDEPMIDLTPTHWIDLSLDPQAWRRKPEEGTGGFGQIHITKDGAALLRVAEGDQSGFVNLTTGELKKGYPRGGVVLRKWSIVSDAGPIHRFGASQPA